MTPLERQREQRRLAAAVDLRAGMSRADVARNYGVARTTTSKWAAAVRAGKPLTSTAHTGRPLRVSRELIAKIFAERKRWTGRAFAEAIADKTGVWYHSDHAIRLLQKLRAELVGVAK